MLGHDWVLDLDIKSFFDDIDGNLDAGRAATHGCKWVLLYLERWLRRRFACRMDN